MFMLQYHINSFTLWTVLPFNFVKDAGLFKFVWRLGTTCHESANKIHAYGYPLGPVKNY